MTWGTTPVGFITGSITKWMTCHKPKCSQKRESSLYFQITYEAVGIKYLKALGV